MDGLVLTTFLLASFFGGVTSGLAGFAMGLVVSGVYLHILTPIQTTILIVGYGFVNQSYGVWMLRRSLNWRIALPFVTGGLFGVPAGTLLLTYTNPEILRIGVGALLVLYGIYGLAKPDLRPVQSSVTIDVFVGFLNGMLAGLTGLGGIIIVIWCQLRNWPKDMQRTVFQPVMLATILTSMVSLLVAGAVTTATANLYLLGLPCMIAGTWVGLQLYGRLDDAKFRKVILVVLLMSGLSLIVPDSVFR